MIKTTPSRAPDRKAAAQSRGCRAFFANERGATALEFAMVATPLMGVILAALQVSIIFYFDQVLQTLTTQVARTVMVGGPQSNSLTQTAFNSQVCGMAPRVFQSSSTTPVSCNGLMIDVQSSSNYSSVSTTPLTFSTIVGNWNYSPGGPGSIVIVRLMYQWPVFGGPLGVGLANQSNGTHLLVGTAVVKNEPYR